MPRRLRIHLSGGFYHVTLRGNHQRDVFVAETDRNLLNKIVVRALDSYGARLHAYCWMSNHLHFLMQVGSEPLANPMRQIAAEFARAMQLKLATTGHFFERRYHANLVEADSYLMELIRYIHLNPVRAGLVDDPVSFPWSSHHAYLGLRAEPWVTTDFCLRMFAPDSGRAIAAYREFLGLDDGMTWEPSKPDHRSVVSAFAEDRFGQTSRSSAYRSKSTQGLDALIDEACRRFVDDIHRLKSPVRDAYLAKVRAWIAAQASRRGIATLSAVARSLGRDEGTLRYAIRKYPHEL
jgi:putative transposase